VHFGPGLFLRRLGLPRRGRLRADAHLGAARAEEGIVLADDFIPLDSWGHALREEMLRQMLQSTEWDVLL
jgi:hypothetical protein